MNPAFLNQMQHAKRLAVFSALLTRPVTLFARNYASVGLNSKKFPVFLLNSWEKQVFICNSSGFPDPVRLYSSDKPERNLSNIIYSVNMARTKGKKAATATTKPAKAESEAKPEKKGKATKKVEEPKAPSRQSKRNVDKVSVSYKEVAENIDEKASESSRPKAKSPSKAKKTKYQVDSGSEVSEASSDEADSEDEKRKKKKRTAPKPRSAAEKKETSTPPAKKAKVEDADSSPDAKKAKSDDEEEEEEDEEVEAVAPVVKKSKSDDAAKKGKSEDAAKKGKSDDVAKKAKSDDTAEPNKTDTDFKAIDFKSDKTTADGKPWNLKISSWNIGGIKSWIKKGALDYIKHEDPDIFCIQETKCSETKLPPGAKVEGYHTYWAAAEKEGYSGIGLYSKVKPIEVKFGLDIPEHDTEGRLITAEYDKFHLVCVYVPNAGRGLVTLPKRLKWDASFRQYVKDLDDKKPVVICGDLNVAHEPIDLTNPKTNTKNAGFTQEERDGMTELLKEGFVDSFRHLYADKTGAYTFWTYMNNARSRNIGWRLDYFLMSEKLVSSLCDNVIRSEVYGSDHCPITLLLNV